MKLQDHIAQRFASLSADYRKQLNRTRKSGGQAAIHDLRVASRRVLETLGVFQGAVDPEAIRPVRRSLKRWMRASGTVRDLDIAIDLATQCGGLLAATAAVRWRKKRASKWKKVLPEIQEASVWSGSTAPESLVPESAAPGQSMIWDYELSAAQNASLALPLLFDRYLLHGAIVDGTAGAGSAPDDAAYHAFRLRTKRFRYTVEAFESFFPTVPFREFLGKLKSFQQILGSLHDCEVANDLWLAVRENVQIEALEDGEVPTSSQRPENADFAVFLKARADRLREAWHAAWAEFTLPEMREATRLFLREGATEPVASVRKRKARREDRSLAESDSRKVS